MRDPVVYVVNDGGSWWRTVRRLVDDPVLIDQLLDNLSASGMDIGRVAPGAELVAETMASGDAYLVRIDAPSGIYVSRVGDDAVVTSAYRSALVTIESAFANDATAAGVPRAVVDELLRANTAHSLGLESVVPGTEYGILFRAERDFGTSRTTMHAVTLSRDGRILWTEPRLSPEPESG